MLRKLFGFWLMLLVLGPARALVLEIGEIQVTSALNQLFDAKIPLPRLTPEELSKISVKLATQPAFKEFGLDRTRTLSKLVFSVEYNSTGEVYVRVVSTEPIREPSLGLLLEFSWPRGKTIREFTVFLDPVQRLAKQTGDRAKTILDSPAASSEPAATLQSTTASVPIPGPAIASTPPVPATETPAAVSSPEAAATPLQPTPLAAATSLQPTPLAAATSLQPTPLAAATSLQPTPLAVAPPLQPTPLAVAPPPATVTMPSVPEPAPVAEISPLTVAATESPESGTLPAPPPLPVEASPLPTYKPGDSYGPVVTGEGLWKIALKVRPDSSITPDDMMQALFKANPQAFAKSGIDGLKIGSILRLPTFREIDKFSGSAAAKNLAEAEETAALSSKAVKGTKSSVVMPGVTKLPEIAQGGARAFPLTPPEVIEPILAETISLAELLAPVKPIQKPDAPRLAVLQTSRSTSETVMAPPLLTPVSATPLLYEAVSEVMTSTVKTPGFAIPAQIVPGSIIADRPVPPQAKEAPRIRPIPMALTIGTRQVIKPLATESTLALPSQTTSSPAVAPPAIEPSLVAETVKPSAADAAMGTERHYQGGGYYGPVLPNERLWDIATKVRPDPSIGKDVMMKALVKVNPPAFSLGMDHMKVGASLRIPTLQEIVTHTGSPAAKQLLEQQAMRSRSPDSSPPGSPD